ncbi:universal stress protein [Mycolicibacterium sp. ELW1]|uniref:universal stress protein n=1 Tax=Mycobacteriaceae TaxID=1762 RepID=UPI0011ED87E3|nr:universal stress protein [Mycobacterium sp. ELW1]QEN14866.1 universal stress protein [Mycobacterium sp. ELW1]
MDVHAVEPPGAVVVGVDGSPWSLNAVNWAVPEAVSRGVTLRLVHAVPTAVPGATESGFDWDAVLVEAQDAANRTHRDVRAETASVIGSPGDVLARESADAAVVCIGARPPHVAAGRLFGATASHLADHARCPVAIIRSGDDGRARVGGVVSVVLSDDPDNDDVVHLAMQEGRLRDATVRQIDRRADSWIRRYPDVHVETVSAGTGWVGRHDGDPHERQVGLAVVGASDADTLTSVSVPNCHPILGYPDCSVLLVRHAARPG